MASLADLFNPTFLMFLGILVLVVALLVVYFESKMREQNHKIASMLSLVSTLAEDMNGVKMGLNHLAIRGGSQQPPVPIRGNLGNSDTNNLIEVSDDEESDEGSEEELEEEIEEELDDTTDGEDISEESDNDDDVKIIKLQVSNEEEDDNSYEEVNNLEFDPTEDLDGFEALDELPEMADDYVEQVLDLKYENLEEKENESKPSEMPSVSDLKTISINLGDEHHITDETIDYKKLQLPKLRSIAVEKGLTTNSDASKLKKPEILKLLGVE